MHVQDVLQLIKPSWFSDAIKYEYVQSRFIIILDTLPREHYTVNKFQLLPGPAGYVAHYR